MPQPYELDFEEQYEIDAPGRYVRRQPPHLLTREEYDAMNKRWLEAVRAQEKK